MLTDSTVFYVGAGDCVNPWGSGWQTALTSHMWLESRLMNEFADHCPGGLHTLAEGWLCQEWCRDNLLLLATDFSSMRATVRRRISHEALVIPYETKKLGMSNVL